MWLGMAFYAEAQTVHLPYFCGFETDAEREGWVIDNGTNVNQWVMDEATAMRGTHSLYISPDEGETASLFSSPGLSVVHKEFELPNGEYELAFDWKLQGGGNDVLLVAWVDNPNDPGVSLSANMTGDFPKVITSTYEKKRLSGSTSWQHVVIPLGRVRSGWGRLVFMFSKKNTPITLFSPRGGTTIAYPACRNKAGSEFFRGY